MTAERRSETIQAAPQSITAVTGAQLQSRGITSVSQLGTEIPGISERNAGPGQAEFEMRGVSSSGGTSPTVGFYLDDVSLTAPESVTQGKVVIDPNLYDLSRVEVLRGPQGTLYGSSSMGGTIRLVTNQPDARAFSASAQATGSGTDGGSGNYGVSGMVNIPLVEDKLALRIVGTDTYTSGWIDRIVSNDFPLPTNAGQTRGDVVDAPQSAVHSDDNWERLVGARVALLWQPIANLTISPTLLYQRIRQGNPNFVDVPPGPSYEAHYQPFDISEPYSDEFELYTIPIKYRIGGIQFDSITAYYNRISSLVEDNSEIGQDFFQNDILLNMGPAPTYAQTGPLTAYEHDQSSQFSQELRISSTGNGPFQWLAGFYYQDFNTKAFSGTSEPSAYVTSILGPGQYFFINQKPNLTQYAGFGEASYRWHDFKLTGGLRYFSYDTEANLTEGGSLIGPTTTNRLPASASGVNPRVNLSYEPTSDLTLYAQAAKGFRPGAANPPPPVTCPTTPAEYDPDKVWSYEGGEKVRLFDRRLIINASGYYEDWSGIQQIVHLACGYGYTSNAGSAHISGSELELSWAVTPALTLTTGLGYTHANLASVVAGTGFTTGQRVQGVPNWTDTTSLVYTHPLNDTYNVVFRATDEYVGNQQEIAYALYTVPSRNLLSFRLGLASKDHVSAWLFANNVTDERKIVEEAQEIFLYVPTLDRAATNQPRTIGVELDYAFGGR